MQALMLKLHVLHPSRLRINFSLSRIARFNGNTHLVMNSHVLHFF